MSNEVAHWRDLLLLVKAHVFALVLPSLELLHVEDVTWINNLSEDIFVSVLILFFLVLNLTQGYSLLLNNGLGRLDVSCKKTILLVVFASCKNRLLVFPDLILALSYLASGFNMELNIKLTRVIRLRCFLELLQMLYFVHLHNKTWFDDPITEKRLVLDVQILALVLLVWHRASDCARPIFLSDGRSWSQICHYGLIAVSVLDLLLQVSERAVYWYVPSRGPLSSS